MQVMKKEIQTYNNALIGGEKTLCDMLANEICKSLPNADYKIWHAHPVWFLNENPVVGYSKLKNGIRLLFWSGQSFNEDLLENEGKFKAACKTYLLGEKPDAMVLQRWLKKAESIQWDYKNLVKRKGKLEPLTGIDLPSAIKAPHTPSEKFTTINHYHAQFPHNIQQTIEKLRKAIKQAAPKATEVISYNMPAFKLNGVLVYYAVNKEHIGFYPTASPIVFFKDELKAYNTSKGAIQFPIHKPLPLSLIKAIVKFRVEEDIKRSKDKKLLKKATKK